MKNQILYSFLLLSVLFSACNSDGDYPASDGQQSPSALELHISAGNFVTDGAADTRATDNGAVTTFEKDDRVGVIMVQGGSDNGGSPILIANNIPYKYDGTGWSFDTSTAGLEGSDKTACLYDNKATYIVYYPYSLKVNGVTSVEGEGGLKSKFPPQKDQSTDDAYRQSDLMVWTGTPTSRGSLKTLNATLTHAYASVYLSLESKYKLANNENISYASSRISDVNFTVDGSSCIPYKSTDGYFRYIFPAGRNSNVRCFYTFEGETHCIAFLASNEVAANTRYVYTQTIDTKEYGIDQVQVGDFYCKDGKGGGYLIPGDASSLTTEQQLACIGIVFWVGDATAPDEMYRRDNDRILGSDHPGCKHGLVVALKDATGQNIVWQTNQYVSVQEWLTENKKNDFLVNDQSSTDNIQGYSNTKAIEAYNADPANRNHIVQVVAKTVDYRHVISAPDNSSGWYLPSIKELALLCGREVNNIVENPSGTVNRNLINGKLRLISKNIQFFGGNYWSSTEINSTYAFVMDFPNGRVAYNFKYAFSPVRCVLAF